MPVLSHRVVQALRGTCYGHGFARKCDARPARGLEQQLHAALGVRRQYLQVASRPDRKLSLVLQGREGMWVAALLVVDI